MSFMMHEMRCASKFYKVVKYGREKVFTRNKKVFKKVITKELHTKFTCEQCKTECIGEKALTNHMANDCKLRK
eukprot:UN10318